MISLLAALAFPKVTVVTLPDASEPTVVIAALARLPKLSDAEKLCAKAAWGALLQGSEDYSALTLRAYTHQAGSPLVAAALQDHLLLRVTFPKDQISTAMAMAESLLRRPLLEVEALQKSLQGLQESLRDPWAAALDPESLRDAKPSRAEILATYRRLVRPENLTLVVAGSFDAAKLESELRRFDDWQPAPEKGYVRPWAASFKPLLQSPNEVGTIELSSPEFSPSDPSAMGPKLLLAEALGIGHGSALFRAAREAEGWSYKQEGFLQPTPSGLRLRLLLAHAGRLPIQEMIEPLREALGAQVKNWTEADRKRALESLRSRLENGIGPSPLRLLDSAGPIESPEDRAHLEGWWRMRFGTDLDRSILLQSASKVTLNELRETASKAIADASVRMLVPRER